MVAGLVGVERIMNVMSEQRRLRVNEIFCSIQGEGTRAGARCVLIRLTGCNLRCSYCDTTYARDEGAWMSLDEITRRVRAYECPTVEVTGGEPLLQPDVYPLLDLLLDEFETVLLETSGAVSIAEVDPRVVRVVDLKCPSSGEMQRNDWTNIDLLTAGDEIKFVIGTRADYEWACEVLSRHGLTSRCAVLLSPVMIGGGAADSQSAAMSPEKLAGWILEDRLDVRLGLQLHKIIWPARTRGV